MLGKRLEEFLKFKKVSPAELSRLTGKSKGYISGILSNPEANPTKEFFDKLSLNFPELNLNWLLIGSGSMLIEKKNIDLTFQEAANKIGSSEEELKNIIKFLVDYPEYVSLLLKARNGDKEAMIELRGLVKGLGISFHQN